MKKIVVIFNTKYGSTKKYAKWLGANLNVKVFEMDKVNAKILKKFNYLIVMSGTYGGKMPLTGFFKKYWDYVKNKKLVAVAVGFAPQDSWWSKLTYFFIPNNIKKKITYFKIKGMYKEKGKPLKKSNLKKVLDFVKKN